MFTMILQTLRYAFKDVRGYASAPSNSFVRRMGASDSDMFRIAVSELPGGVSLQDFHYSFLSSPLFQLELWMLTYISTVDPAITTSQHLRFVASGDKSSFGPWTAWGVEGKRKERITSSSDPASACQIMRCYISGKPFCDTWWAVEKSPDCQSPELVFGTAMIRTSGQKPSFMWKLTDPFHRLYSRLLLASAKYNLIRQSETADKKKSS